MRVRRIGAVVALGIGMPALAAAQGTTTTTDPTAGQTGTTTGTTTDTTRGQIDRTTQPASDYGLMGPATSHWIASGFVGSNFGASATSAAADFGGSVGYVWNSWVGGEFMAGFTPNFNVANPALFAGQTPQVNSFMANAVGMLPLGGDGQWAPFISGGFGAMTLRSGALNNGTGNAVSDVFSPDDTRPAADIGGGIMAFVGAWGVRADIRYFRAFSTGNPSTVTSPAGVVASSVLPGLDFWRANVGVAVRW